MALTLKFEHPHLPEDQEIAVNFLGTVKNGGSVEIDEDTERMFVANRGMTVEDALKDNATLSVSGSSSLSQDETDQLIEAAAPAPVEEQPTETPEQSNVFRDEGVNDNA